MTPRGRPRKDQTQVTHRTADHPLLKTPALPLDQSMQDKVKERPAFLDTLVHGSKNKEMHKVLSAVKQIKGTECVTYKADEFFEKFGKTGRANLQTFLRTKGIAKPRVVEDGGIFYVWSNDI